MYTNEKRKLLKSISNLDHRERVRYQLPSEQTFRPSAYKSKRVPKAPVTLKEIDFSVLDTENLNT